MIYYLRKSATSLTSLVTSESGWPFVFMLLSNALLEYASWKSVDKKVVTARGYYQILRQFVVFMRDCEVEKVDVEDITIWLTLMRKLRYEHNTLVPICVALRGFFNYLSMKKHKVFNPLLIPSVSSEPKIPRVLTDENYQKLLSVIPKNNDPRQIRNAALIRMYHDTGARNSEVLSLNIKDIDLEKNKARIRTAKSRQSVPYRDIYWTAETGVYLKKWIAKREKMMKIWNKKEEDAVFVGCSTIRVGIRLTNRGVGEMLRRYSHKAKIEIVNAHSIRHRKGRKIAQTNNSGPDIMNLLGHVTLSSSTVYTRLWGNELDAIAQKHM